MRKKIKGTSERPRLCVQRSHRNYFVQIIDDTQGKTLFSLSTLNKELKEKLSSRGNIQAARTLGKTLAQKAKEKNIHKVVFDRRGFPYVGGIKAFAEGAREGGLEF